MELDFVEFDKQAFEKSKVWLRDSYIRKMICAREISEDDQNKWFWGLPSRSDYKIWAVLADGVIIGVSGIKDLTEDSCEYFGYIGNSDYRMKGLGKKMLLSTIGLAKSLFGVQCIKLKVLHINEPAIKLYKNNGFVEYATDENFCYMKFIG